MQRCQKGELAAYEVLYRHFGQPLLNLGLRMLGNRQDAEDAVQTAFLKLYRRVGQFRFNSKLSTYLFRIMTNVCLDALGRRKHDKPEPGEVSQQVYHSQVELKLQLEEAIQTLPEKMKACFVLFAVQEFKQSEVAEILNVKPGTVKAHIFEAKSRLRALLSETGEESR